jgi:hypothetical protein
MTGFAVDPEFFVMLMGSSLLLGGAEKRPKRSRLYSIGFLLNGPAV